MLCGDGKAGADDDVSIDVSSLPRPPEALTAEDVDDDTFLAWAKAALAAEMERGVVSHRSGAACGPGSPLLVLGEHGVGAFVRKLARGRMPTFQKTPGKSLTRSYVAPGVILNNGCTHPPRGGLERRPRGIMRICWKVSNQSELLKRPLPWEPLGWRGARGSPRPSPQRPRSKQIS